MRTFARLATVATALTLGAGAVAAQSKAPDLSGTWEMDATRSDFGPSPKPAKMTLTITQTGATRMTIVTASRTEMGDQSITSNYTIDGAPHQMPTRDNVAQTSTTRWDAGTFVVDAKMTQDTVSVGVRTRFTLSPDGKLLTINRHISAPGGEADLRIVFVKQ